MTEEDDIVEEDTLENITLDLNNDSTINTQDFAILASYIGNDDQSTCYENFQPSLPTMGPTLTSQEQATLVSNLDPGIWCDVLTGILETAYNGVYNRVADLNSDQTINPLDLAMLASMDDDNACFNRFVGTYSYSDYENVDWCNGLYVGMSNYMTEEDDIEVPVVIDYSLTNRLKGRILLQVESRGEAWYVKPDTGKRIYIADGEVAYSMMRNLGLGITNIDLAKIPVGVEDRFESHDSDGDGLSDKLEEGLGTNVNNVDSDGDGYNDRAEVVNGYNPLGNGKIIYDNNLVNSVYGRILLQVESRGEAWYVNPVDGKRYYMKDGFAAYQIMRYLSLGITNSDLNKIDF